MSTRKRLLGIFDLLLAAFGKRHWWPGETELEIMVGAVLTQNTSWRNVEKAIGNMKAQGILDVARLHEIEKEDLGRIIRSAGFYNVKAVRLKNMIKVIYEDFGESIDNLRLIETGMLRRILLGINGLGPETVDSILLYALNRPVFVVDAYTKRFLKNHGLLAETEEYHGIQAFFQSNLPSDIYLFNEFHALIVALCQTHCRKNPLCEECPLKSDLDRNGAAAEFTV